ncbi:MAG TPA: hypothetical protein VGR57_20965 [Ktedonobacterales bacterium]|nr:hypothetical protein [Ktedonobacterales bacterium]
MGQELIARAGEISPVVILAGVLVLAGLRPRAASVVRFLSFATLAAALLAAVCLASLFFNLIGCPPYGDFCGLQLIIAAYLLYFAAVGLCLLTGLAASVSLARWWRWGQMALVGAFGVLPLAYLVVIRDFVWGNHSGYVNTVANSLPLTATLSLLPLFIYGLFFHTVPRELDQPSNGTTRSV